MPAGPVHFYHLQRRWPSVFVANAILLLLTFAVRRDYWWAALEFNLFSIFWYWMARYIDPDLDQRGITSAEGRMMRELGPLGVLMASYFSFYANLMHYIAVSFRIRGLFGAHQSKLTHSVIPGTAIRMAFLYFPIPVLLPLVLDFSNMLLSIVDAEIFITGEEWFIYFAAQFITLGYADYIHISLDQKHGDDKEVAW